MIANQRWRRRTSVALLIAALAVHETSALTREPEQFKGLSLAEALQALQARGLRIVFTSAIVTADMRVRSEPRAATARQQLDELLAQHGLMALEGPGGTIKVVRAEPGAVAPPSASTGTIEGLVVHALTAEPLAGVVVRVVGTIDERRTDSAGRFRLRGIDAGTRIIRASSAGYLRLERTVRVVPSTTIIVTLSLSPAAATHNERVTVSPPKPQRDHPGLASERSLDRSELDRLHGSTVDDPIRIVHAFPRASAIDDFRSDFAVRGSPFRHVDLVIDGVSTQWLQHTAHRRGATGSLPMLGGQVLERATLRAGAYPRRYADQLGPQLDLTIREGSRESFGLRGSIGGTNAAIVGEGPFGSSRRGSWLIAVRHSYLEWPAERAESTRTAFGFADGLAKIVYDVHPSQQVGLSVLGGITNVDGEDNLAPDEPGDGTNRASLVSLSWRSTFGSTTVVTQRAYLVKQGFVNRRQTGGESDRGANEEIAYRADVVRPLAGGLLEAGARIGRTAIRDVPRASDPGEDLAGGAWVRAAYAHFAWAPAPSLTLSPGLRVTDSTLLAHHAISRWVLAEWSFRTGWTVNASAGVAHQSPSLHHVLGRAAQAGLRPERAAYFDAGLEQRVTDSAGWQLTVFRRTEDDMLREPDVHPRLVGAVIAPPGPDEAVNGLEGSSRGIELVVDRRKATGLSGWAAYSYGETRYTDSTRHETFWADFDQRHSFNLSGAYSFANGTSVGATFRAGSNFPIPGYLERREGGLFVGQHRNRVRLPAYARLDVRGHRQLQYFGRRFTFFVEVLNVLNRRNAGLAGGHVDLVTGKASGFTDTLLPRRAAAGVLIEF